jgi:hypothetical protein
MYRAGHKRSTFVLPCSLRGAVPAVGSTGGTVRVPAVGSTGGNVRVPAVDSTGDTVQVPAVGSTGGTLRAVCRCPFLVSSSFQSAHFRTVSVAVAVGNCCTYWACCFHDFVTHNCAVYCVGQGDQYYGPAIVQSNTDRASHL